MKCFELEYDVVLSFAGEDRKYVEQTAKYLKNKGVKVFYDSYETVDLWGKDLYQHLDNIYQNKAKYAVIFISESYSKKLWTNHELKSAQARAFSENEEYILPVRFDDTEIPGIRKTVGYLSLETLKPFELGKKIIEKLGTIEPVEFMPKNAKFVKSILTSIYKDFSEEASQSCVNYVFNVLKKTNNDERFFLLEMIKNSCKHDVETDLHHDIKLLQRVTGFDREKIISIIDDLSNLGFEYKILHGDSNCEVLGQIKKTEMLHLSLYSLDLNLELQNLTIVLFLMYLQTLSLRCESCSFKTLSRLDFTDVEDKMTKEALEYVQSCLVFEDDLE